jgi:hypothetical protein
MRRSAALLLVIPALALASAPGDGAALYQAGRFQEAVDAFETQLVVSPDDPDLVRQLAAARYRAGDGDGAARLWDALAQRSGAPEDLFNAANAHHQAGRLDDALARYDAVLAEAPDYGLAAINRDRVARELELRRRPPQAQAAAGDAPRDHGGSPSPGDAPGAAGSEGPPGGPPGKPGGDPSQPGDASSQEPAPEGEGPPGEPAKGGRSDSREGNPSVGQVDPGTVADPGEAAGRPGGDQAVGPAPTGAERVLSGVEEGRPRVHIPGTSSERPW